MLQVAARLDARVQGDDGEFYTSPEQVPADEFFAEQPRRRRFAACAVVASVPAVARR